MAITLQALKQQIATEVEALSTAKAQLAQLEGQIASLGQQAAGFRQQVEDRSATIATLKTDLYAFFEETFVANPQATTYAAMGQKMDEAAAAP